MSGPGMGPRTFDVDELGSIDPGDRAAALEGARRLQSIDDQSITPSAGFADRVMAAIATEPNPAPTGFLAPLRRRGIVAGFAASVREAWASVGGTGRPALARGAALAYVLAVAVAGVSLAGVAAVGGAGALGLFAPTATESPPPTAPAPTLAPEPTLGPEPTVQPTVEPVPPSLGPSPSPSESPDESDDNEGGGAEPSDDHGGSSGSDGVGAESETETPEPSDTPRPTGTPKPSQTPH